MLLHNCYLTLVPKLRLGTALFAAEVLTHTKNAPFFEKRGVLVFVEQADPPAEGVSRSGERSFEEIVSQSKGMATSYWQDKIELFLTELRIVATVPLSPSHVDSQLLIIKLFPCHRVGSPACAERCGLVRSSP
jgi:hypothetical protein